MIKAYIKVEESYKPVPVDADELVSVDKSQLIWLDLFSPTPDEIRSVEEVLKIELPTRQESEEIEFSSRYWEDDTGIEINTYFLVRQDDKAHNETISFIARDKVLVTIRFSDLRIFTEFSRKLRLNSSAFHNGLDVLSGILAMRVDMDADIVEMLSKEIAGIGRREHNSFRDPGLFLELVTGYEDIHITLRENLTDKQRILSSLLKSSRVPESLKKEFTMMMKDVNSLVSSANFNFERLDYLQSIFLNFMSVEQNKVIKIFTVMSVIFLPPTLIASIYGMNFRLIPELQWQYGYPLALLLIVVSAVLPIYIFKKKGWL